MPVKERLSSRVDELANESEGNNTILTAWDQHKNGPSIGGNRPSTDLDNPILHCSIIFYG